MKGKVVNQKFSGFLKIPDFKESHRTRSVTTERLSTQWRALWQRFFLSPLLLYEKKARLRNNGAQTAAWVSIPREPVKNTEGKPHARVCFSRCGTEFENLQF